MAGRSASRGPEASSRPVRLSIIRVVRARISSGTATSA
jgi:hypothetical protein